jgi:DNA-binding XRE family transcriptional regulator
MPDNISTSSRHSAATHLGRQMKRDRQAHGWSLREFAARTGVNFSTLSQIENGKRPFSERLAIKCDGLFPERRGWYLTYYDESKSWVPAGFRSWAEYEDKATILHIWCPGILHGFVQTEDYARAVLETEIGATAEQVTARLASRMARQQRVLYRQDPPRAWFVVDEFALYRLVGGPEVMADQMRHLLEVAALPTVTLTVMPPVLHPANESGFVVTDGGAAYTEHVVGGYVFSDDQTATSLAMRFDRLRAESRKATESLGLIERMERLWTRGVRAATAGQPAAIASKSASQTYGARAATAGRPAANASKSARATV